jgi:hypothetical protein
VHPVRHEVAVPGDLVDPVDDDARRAHHQEPAPSTGGEAGHHRDGLDRLAQSHLVADDDAFAGQRELGPEHLVAAQRHVQQAGVQRGRVDLVLDVGRDETVGGTAIRHRVRTGEVGEERVVGGRVELVVAPQRAVVQVRHAQLCAHRAQRRHVATGQQGLEPA